MDDLSFSIIVYVIVSIGLVSVAWLFGGMKKISDRLLKDMFRRLVALTIVTIAFAFWILLSTLQELEGPVYRFTMLISLVAVFATISGAALSAKKICDEYGFNVPEKKGKKKKK